MNRHFKILLPALTSVFMFGATVFLFILPSVEKNITTTKREMIKELTNMVSGILDTYADMEANGALTRKQVQDAARARLKNIHDNEEHDNHFWIIELPSGKVVYPYQPGDDSTMRPDPRDPMNQILFSKAVQFAVDKGAGFLTYETEDEVSGRSIESPISYVRLYKPWNWVIGTAVFLKDVDAEMETMSQELTLMGAFVLLIVSLFSGFIIQQSIRIDGERKAAREELVDTLEKQRAILESSPDPIVVYDDQGNTLYINPAFSRLFGWTKEEVMGKRISFVPDDEYERTMDGIRSVYQKEENLTSFESKRIKANGDIIPVEINAGIYRDQTGEALGMVVHLTDITRFKDYERALRESEEKFRNISANAIDGIVMINPEGKIVFWNAAAEKMFGYSTDEVLGREARSILIPERHHLKYINNFQYLKEEGAAEPVGRTLEATAVRKSGDEFPVELSISSLQLKDERFIVGIVRDITKRKQDQIRLLKSESGLIKAQEIAQVGNWDWNLHTYRLEWSDEIYRIFGLNREHDEVDYEKALAIVHPEDREYVDRIIKQTIQGAPHNFEYRVLRSDGSIRYVHEIGELALDEHGKPLRMFGVVQDITDRKLAEEEKTRLESLLRQSQKMEAIGTLAGGIAHDFNNILSSIIGYTEMALLEAPEGHIKKDLNDVLDSADRAKDLVRQILTFSRQAEQEWRAIRIGPIIKESLKLLRASLPTTVEIRQDIEVMHDVIWGEATQIHQIMINLCSNASHAMREQGGILDIRLKAVKLHPEAKDGMLEIPPGDYLELTVSDNGHGMTESVKARIFDPFYTTKSRGEGTGMGLAVVHGIVHNLEGTVTVESTLNMGTVFRILLPQYKGEAQLEHPTAKAAPRGSEHILFVDDEVPLLNIWQRVLETLGYCVTALPEGEQALERFRQDPDQFDLVITDQTMPRMTGTELTQQLLAIKNNIPIILCTGFSETVGEDEAKELGISRFVLKPTTLHEMAEAVRGVLDQDRNAPSSK